jgi:hypothetical protein
VCGINLSDKVLKFTVNKSLLHNLFFPMLREFRNLNDSEKDFLTKAPILVCVLIAGADGTIDKKEVNEAIVQAKRRQAQHGLTEFYAEVGQDFEDKLKIVLRDYPSDPVQRNKLISDDLKIINEIFPKLDKDFALRLYKSLREIAMKIAQSSGGILGMNSIGKAESEFVELPMIKEPPQI